MKASKYILAALSLACCAGSASAQFIIDGQIIPRAEYRHGFKSLVVPSQPAAFFIEQRSRIRFQYGAEKIKYTFSLQDIRTWGSQPQLNKTDGLSSVHEAYAEYAFSKKFALRAGRQELDYNDARILGNVDWAMQARSHDVALFKYTDSLLTIHAGLAANQDKEQSNSQIYTVTGNYKAMQYLWLNRPFGKINLSVLFLNHGLQYAYTSKTDGATNSNTQYSQTAGFYGIFKNEKWKISLSFYDQFGKDGSMKQSDNYTPKDLSAIYAGFEAGFMPSQKLYFAIGGEYLSGNSQLDTTKAYNNVNHAFNPFYGTNHKFNGYMDYFYVGNHIGSVGLQDAYVRFKYIAEKYFCALDVHQFMAAADVLDMKELTATGKRAAMSPMLGTEIDITFNYSFSKPFALQAGYSHMLGTETMEAVKGGKADELNNWCYLMLIFKPELFRK